MAMNASRFCFYINQATCDFRIRSLIDRKGGSSCGVFYFDYVREHPRDAANQGHLDKRKIAVQGTENPTRYMPTGMPMSMWA